MAEARLYAKGTMLLQSFPWGTYAGGKALCADGKVRTLKRIALTADTFFSVPASVTAQGKTVSGYITVTTLSGSDVETADDPAVVKFIAYKYGKNGNAIKGENDGTD